MIKYVSNAEVIAYNTSLAAYNKTTSVEKKLVIIGPGKKEPDGCTYWNMYIRNTKGKYVRLARPKSQFIDTVPITDVDKEATAILGKAMAYALDLLDKKQGR